LKDQKCLVPIEPLAPCNVDEYDEKDEGTNEEEKDKDDD